MGDVAGGGGGNGIKVGGGGGSKMGIQGGSTRVEEK